jgi:hypothetical protein
MENQNIPEAIREISKLTAQAQEPVVHDLVIEEPHGTSIKIPVAFVAAAGGAMNVQSLAAVVRDGLALATEQREATAPGPDNREGTAQHHTLRSFTDHVLRFKGEHSVIWADLESHRLLSVFDYHPAGATGTGWQRHHGVYPCPLSEAWAAWGGGRSLQLSQDDLARLLDTRDRDLSGGDLNGKTAPDPAWMLSFLGKLESTSEAKAKMSRDPNTHQRKLSYSREAGFVGDIVPPKAFLIRIPVFQGQLPETLEVRLRAEVNSEGEAAFEVQIHDALNVLRESFDDLCAEVQAKTEVPLFVGHPEGFDDDDGAP